jgi:hypothetical protein
VSVAPVVNDARTDTQAFGDFCDAYELRGSVFGRHLLSVRRWCGKKWLRMIVRTYIVTSAHDRSQQKGPGGCANTPGAVART